MDERTPSAELVDEYLELWDEKQKDNYVPKERCLEKLFYKYPANVDMDEVLIKVSSLNDLYITKIKPSHIVPVAKHIVELGIDRYLQRQDLDTVNDIADNEQTSEYYSFATKYCSFHLPEDYPMYDSHIDGMLQFFMQDDDSFEWQKDTLRHYPTFYAVLMKFIKRYKLGKFDLKEIDRYLWQAYNA